MAQSTKKPGPKETKAETPAPAKDVFETASKDSGLSNDEMDFSKELDAMFGGDAAAPDEAIPELGGNIDLAALTSGKAGLAEGDPFDLVEVDAGKDGLGDSEDDIFELTEIDDSDEDQPTGGVSLDDLFDQTLLEANAAEQPAAPAPAAAAKAAPAPAAPATLAGAPAEIAPDELDALLGDLEPANQALAAPAAAQADDFTLDDLFNIPIAADGPQPAPAAEVPTADVSLDDILGQVSVKPDAAPVEATPPAPAAPAGTPAAISTDELDALLDDLEPAGQAPAVATPPPAPAAQAAPVAPVLTAEVQATDVSLDDLLGQMSAEPDAAPVEATPPAPAAPSGVPAAISTDELDALLDDLEPAGQALAAATPSSVPAAQAAPADLAPAADVALGDLWGQVPAEASAVPAAPEATLEEISADELDALLGDLESVDQAPAGLPLEPAGSSAEAVAPADATHVIGDLDALSLDELLDKVEAGPEASVQPDAALELTARPADGPQAGSMQSDILEPGAVDLAVLEAIQPGDEDLADGESILDPQAGENDLRELFAAAERAEHSMDPLEQPEMGDDILIEEADGLELLAVMPEMQAEAPVDPAVQSILFSDPSELDEMVETVQGRDLSDLKEDIAKSKASEAQQLESFDSHTLNDIMDRLGRLETGLLALTGGPQDSEAALPQTQEQLLSRLDSLEAQIQTLSGQPAAAEELESLASRLDFVERSVVTHRELAELKEELLGHMRQEVTESAIKVIRDALADLSNEIDQEE